MLTEPGLLIALDLDGEPKVGELDGGALALAGQQKVLRLENVIKGLTQLKSIIIGDWE